MTQESRDERARRRARDQEVNLNNEDKALQDNVSTIS